MEWDPCLGLDTKQLRLGQRQLLGVGVALRCPAVSRLLCGFTSPLTSYTYSKGFRSRKCSAAVQAPRLL